MIVRVEHHSGFGHLSYIRAGIDESLEEIAGQYADHIAELRALANPSIEVGPGDTNYIDGGEVVWLDVWSDGDVAGIAAVVREFDDDDYPEASEEWILRRATPDQIRELWRDSRPSPYSGYRSPYRLPRTIDSMMKYQREMIAERMPTT